MNAGAIAQLLHQCPYRFNGIDVLADIFFVVNLAFYVIFSCLFITRFVVYRWNAYEEIVSSMVELTFVPCWAIAFMTLTSNVTLVVSTASWGGYPFSIVAYAMFWIVQTWNMVLLFWAFITLIRRHDSSDRRMPISIIIPAVSVSTVAITGAVVATFAKDLSATLAVPVMIVSFNWVGVGILMGLILYVYLFHSLLAQGWPPPDQTGTLFILVGPMGQSAAALQLLGAAATTYGRFGDYNSGTFLTAEAAKGLDAACVLIALLFNGLGVVWLIFGIYAMIERAVQKQLRWTPSWNAIVFPNATLTTSFLVFAIEMDSPAYRVITAILTILLIIVFFINLAFTILRISQGRLLIVKEDWRVKEELDGQQKQK
jgi:tellurite resistance protein TehA-like permease